jgi:ATP:ADP antiporter, AAA family
LSLSFIVLGYNISINLADLSWKSQLCLVISDPQMLLRHMSYISMVTGFIASGCAITLHLIMKRFGWTKLALVTPFVMASLGLIFFGCRFGFMDGFAGLLGLTPLALTAYSGSLQSGLSKGFKYSVFDSTKEMAFLPLSEGRRAKGKAAIDGLGSGLGKSGASLMTQGLIIFMGSLSAASPAIATILGIVLVTWVIAVTKLGKSFTQESVQASEAVALS